MTASSKLLAALITLGAAGPAQAAAYQGSTFGDVWDQVASDPYEVLPQREVTLGSFGAWFSQYLRSAARRTLDDRSDLLPPFRKLVHPTGTCLAGTWRIDQDSVYTGYFAQGSEALIIARASSALGEADVGHYRSFGLAGKLFPTTDPGHQDRVRTANFFTVDDLGGTMIENFVDTTLLNKPKLTTAGRGLHVQAIGAAVGAVFSAADSNPNERQLYEISELGMNAPQQAITPRFMRLKAASETVKLANYSDFRQDLRLANYEDGIAFVIEVSRDGNGWQRLGQITFDQDVASASCDSRLHFHHPQHRGNLRFAP